MARDSFRVQFILIISFYSISSLSDEWRFKLVRIFNFKENQYQGKNQGDFDKVIRKFDQNIRDDVTIQLLYSSRI